MKQQFPSKESREFENESHIARKKKAEARKMGSKNYKDLAQYVDKHDEDDDVEKYVRYIK